MATWSRRITAYKAKAFSHEREVRLLQVVNRESPDTDRVVNIPINPSNLFSQVTLDPRLGVADRLQREKDLRGLGYTGSITTSELYQSTLFEINCLILISKGPRGASERTSAAFAYASLKIHSIANDRSQHA